MPKSEIHPKWYPDAKVICNGEVVMTTGSTQPNCVTFGVEPSLFYWNPENSRHRRKS